MEIERVKESMSSYGRHSADMPESRMEHMPSSVTDDGKISGMTAKEPAEEKNEKTSEYAEQGGTGSSNTQIKKAVDEINKKMHNSEAIFGIHEATNRVMIKIVDKDSKEILKEYPPEKTLDMIAKVWEVAGLLVDEKL